MSEEHELKLLRDFAIVPAIHEKLARLVQIAEFEDWNYKNTPTTFNPPILYNYVQRTFTRVHEQNKIAISLDQVQVVIPGGRVVLGIGGGS